MKIEIYQFRQGEKTWNLTNQRKDLTYKGTLYKSVSALERTDIEDESIEKCDFETIVPQIPILNSQNEDLVALFNNRIYLESVYLTLIELTKNNSNPDGYDSLVLFMGRVTHPKFNDDEEILTLNCSTSESYLKRNILVKKFQRVCPNNIYDRWCGLNFNDFAFEATITAISGMTVTFAVSPTQAKDEEGNPLFDEYDNPVMETKTYLSNYLVNGLINKAGVYTLITASSTNAARLYREHAGLKVNDIVWFAPGCDQSLKVCQEKFNNGRRYCGHPYMPSENPTRTELIK